MIGLVVLSEIRKKFILSFNKFQSFEIPANVIVGS
jgi:hypothetical protein